MCCNKSVGQTLDFYFLWDVLLYKTVHNSPLRISALSKCPIFINSSTEADIDLTIFMFNILTTMYGTNHEKIYYNFYFFMFASLAVIRAVNCVIRTFAKINFSKFRRYYPYNNNHTLSRYIFFFKVKLFTRYKKNKNFI